MLTVFVGEGVILSVTTFVDVIALFVTGDAVIVECTVVDAQLPCTKAVPDRKVSVDLS